MVALYTLTDNMVPVAVLLIALAASQAHAECCGGSERDEILQKLAVLDNKLNDLQHMCMSREECPSGWTAYKTSCYKAVSTIMSFDGARARCQEDGADIVDISSQEENHMILKLAQGLKPAPQQVWVGFRRRGRGGAFYWVTGAETSFTHWAKGEPNYAEEECTFMYVDPSRSSRPQGTWNNTFCKSVQGWGAGYACKMKQRQ
ncbi:alpha-N-acetylgalactosamine-specific lectin [Nematostella vectensis]|uniref:alpha-N-acetylgalactosamine-specific lectin n=1 Tax=Nematostella vectensis TaxID=45351 RepID=UPI00138FC33B|nr:alpha-N-acetylgalactosamine-specific lectin [Nematostella vectensis]